MAVPASRATSILRNPKKLVNKTVVKKRFVSSSMSKEDFMKTQLSKSGFPHRSRSDIRSAGHHDISMCVFKIEK